MKGLTDSVSEDTGGFGPITDLIISVVAVLIIMLALFAERTKAMETEYQQLKDHSLKAANELLKIERSQKEIIRQLASKYNTQAREIQSNVFEIQTPGGKGAEIIVENDLSRQRITFGNQILFDVNSDFIKPAGSDVLRRVGEVIKHKIELIEEIQVQGHADNIQPATFKSNLDLAAARSIAVFRNLQYSAGIDPASSLMSIASFGEFMPVQRKAGSSFSKSELNASNLNEYLRSRNRRIEIVLNFKKEY